MAGPPLTPAQLRSHVAEARRKDPGDRVVGVQAAGGWAGGDRVECGGRTYAVAVADSPLAVRAALRAAEASPQPTVVLTAAGGGDLGLDVLARLSRRQLLSLDLWEAVRALFGARDVDPAARVPAVGRALLEYAPAGGYSPVATGLLDPGTAWRCVFRAALGLANREAPDRDPTDADVVAWALSNHVASGRYAALPADLRDAARRRLADALGPAAGVVLDVMDRGAGGDALAVALALEVVYAEEPPPSDLAVAAGRLERFHGGRSVPAAVARRLARAAAEVLAGMSEDEAGRHRRRADALLAEVGATAALHRGTQTPGAWEARLARYADTLGRAVADTPGRPDPAVLIECRARLRDLETHALRPAFPEVFARAEAAARLLAWLVAGPPVPVEPGALAAAYRDDHAFADWARDRISGGEAGAELSAAYRRLEEAVGRVRAGFNRAFAAAVAGGDLPGALPVESVLDAAVVPAVGAGHRVLMILLDGLSWAVAHELLADLRRQGWQEQTWHPSGDAPPSLLAAVPSVTEFSRASLFCGRIARGDAGGERAGFAAHPGLAAACDRKHPPVVFHKAAVTDGPRGRLHDDVQQAVMSEKARAVAVVVNAVDDDLGGAAQVRVRWSVDAIRPLAALLKAARDAGRLVMVAGDHGHGWHPDAAERRAAAETGGRWRPAGGAPPGDGEVLVRGRRVQDGRGGDAVIVPWEEGVRYGGSKKGYHGGVTPQEMLAPLVLLSHASAPARKGLKPCRLTAPEWCFLAPDAPPRPEPAASLPPPPRRPTGTFFDLLPAEAVEPPELAAGSTPPPAPTGPVWVGRLIGSEVYRGQREAAGKHLPTEVEVRRSLAALDAAGGALTFDGFARQAGVPPLRLDGFLAKLQRLLNVDGYEAIGVDRTADRVSLNRAVLETQFEIG